MLLAFAVLTTRVSGGPLGVDEQFTVWLRAGALRPLGTLFEGMRWLGSALLWDSAVLLIAAAFWWRGDRRSATLLLLGLSVEAAVVLVKAVVNRPQPGGWLAESVWGASFPSGHVTRAVVTLGLLIALTVWRSPRWRLPGTLGVLGFLLLLGASRVAVEPQAHWPTDVIGGYLLGMLWLELLLAGTFWYRRRARIMS